MQYDNTTCVGGNLIGSDVMSGKKMEVRCIDVALDFTEDTPFLTSC